MTAITLFGHQIPIYGLCGVIGVILGFIYLAFACKISGMRYDDLVYVYVWALIFCMIGAKILYLLVSIPFLIPYISAHGLTWPLIIGLIQGGFVFYGGLIGGLIGAWASCRYFHFDLHTTFNVLVPVLPLVHGFGRIGCSLAGCCYGVETDSPFHIIYHNSLYAPLNKPLFPVQPLEAGLLFVLFIGMVLAVFKYKTDKALILYLFSYSLIRFILEYFRGDAARGIWLHLSTSQWISLAILGLTAKSCFDAIDAEHR